ncbi:MAG: MotA/TolQ/ExbB proton channel family protein [Bacteroidetes bacterium]|uniref:MotA/TolQ/ExbB proton channel family protein n=1 Tax=Phaeocystidibacter marisrubri TaxID=1577780 RepID=A0A6L3ZCP7_9FLAO|nr:MotA/TolQ/ExbB proton channel family protein [Phaeocystidibacter marisrubri]KAB2815221.1 MotA/TolQ/ExbB proton channel family protein [Phaeocystidibacter marisrubri]TNE27248.1 MAG: MotA/TolQ/ExbB proton channel family protein [Bacteroidota bacterium]GGH70955.1 flagellar motor protein MotA [Phaeocystidibacter marisrubri]
MRRVLSLLVLAGMLSFGTANAQDEMSSSQEQTEQADASMASGDSSSSAEAAEAPMEEAAAPAETSAPAPAQEEEYTQVLRRYFIEGGAGFMGIVLVALILGLAIVIERILYLTFSISNNDRLLRKVEEALNSGGVEAAKEVCRGERGPVATIFYEGLDHYDEGIEMVDKSIISVGSVEQGKLDKGVSWISLFIALAPMLGFMGTVIGMIQAFDAIEAAGDINPSLVAGGIKVALLTTVFGLIVAIILQIFYNLIVAMIDNIVNKMEDASISFLDLIIEFEKKNK